jgi:hypothetical protein
MGSKYSLVLLLLGMIILTTVVGERNSNNFGHSPMLDPEDDWPEIFHEPLPSNYKIPKEEPSDYETNLSDKAINHTV